MKMRNRNTFHCVAGSADNKLGCYECLILFCFVLLFSHINPHQSLCHSQSLMPPPLPNTRLCVFIYFLFNIFALSDAVCGVEMKHKDVYESSAFSQSSTMCLL